MAIISSKELWWNNVSDASTYRVRIVPNEAVFDDWSNLAGFAYDETVQTANAEITVDLGSLSNVPIIEGTYDIFITAVDEAGNESDPLEVADALLDFQPPSAPTAGGIR